MALIDKEIIRTEIERRYYRYGGGAKVMADDAVDATMLELEDLLAFLDTLPEQPVEGLEEKIDKYFQGWFNDDEYGDAVTPDYTGVNVDKCKEIARHFYDLGCRHTAVMYDDIEYERQRAEEAELSEGLDAEMDKYFESMEVLEHENIFEDTFHKIARHFAEWGAEHLKK